MKLCSIVITCAALLPLEAAAQSRNDPRTMQRLWTQANEQCRGGSGDEASTLASCDEREAYSKRLHQLGRCYGKEGQSGYQMEWHHCGRGSL